MWTSRAVACVALLLVVANNNCSAQSTPKYTRVIETQLSNPTTVKVGANLYTISKRVQYLEVNSTSGTSCKLRINPLDENIQGRLQAASLNNAKQFLVWGIRKIQGTSRDYTLLIVDPNACSYIPVTLPTESGVSSSWPVFLPQIMVQERSYEFRVFYPERSCSPCRFDYNGRKREQDYGSLPRYGKPASHFWIDSYLRSASFDRYFYAYNLANGSSIVQVLSVHYRKEVSKSFDHQVDAASIKQGSYQNTAICYKSADKRKVTCERLDMNLEAGLVWELPLSKHVNVSDVSIDVDSVGNTFIGVITTCRLHLYVYNVVGELTADLDFGRVDRDYVHREVKGIALGDEFCLVAVAYKDLNAKDTRHVVKCVDISKFIED